MSLLQVNYFPPCYNLKKSCTFYQYSITIYLKQGCISWWKVTCKLVLYYLKCTEIFSLETRKTKYLVTLYVFAEHDVSFWRYYRQILMRGINKVISSFKICTLWLFSYIEWFVPPQKKPHFAFLHKDLNLHILFWKIIFIPNQFNYSLQFVQLKTNLLITWIYKTRLIFSV